MRTLDQMTESHGLRPVTVHGTEVTGLIETLHGRGWIVRKVHGRWLARRAVAAALGLAEASENTSGHVKVAEDE